MDVVVIPGNRLVGGLVMIAWWLVLYHIVVPLHLACVDPPRGAPRHAPQQGPSEQGYQGGGRAHLQHQTDM